MVRHNPSTWRKPSKSAQKAPDRKRVRASACLKAALFVALLGGGAAADAQTADRVEVVIGDAGQRDADGSILIELRVLNGGDVPAAVLLADRIEARLVADAGERRAWLDRDEPIAGGAVPPGGFARARYRLRVPEDAVLDGAILSIPALSHQQVAIVERPYPGPAIASVEPGADSVDERSLASRVAPPPGDRTPGNQFLEHFSAYQPIYAAYGPARDSEARLQVSFKYQLLESGEPGSPRGGQEGLYFGYTQRMFWDLDAKSSPFRNIDFQPELFYVPPARTLANGITVGGQVGVMHESNGREGPVSRSLNAIYVAPMAAVPLGGGYRLSVAPRLWAYVGDLSDNPDIRRYRGNTGLSAEIGADAGVRLSTTTRFNFSTGKGAFSVDLSYPLPAISNRMPPFFLFGQTFVGYGENLLDYDRRTTRVRIGLALIR